MLNYLAKRLSGTPPPLSANMAALRSSNGSGGSGGRSGGIAGSVGESLGDVHGRAAVQDEAALSNLGTLEEGRV